MNPESRYAVYLVPEPGSPLWQLASAWLGYDAIAGRNLAQPALAEFDAAALSAATEDPRRYGFHLTLKAPFRLLQGRRVEDLALTLAGCAAGPEAKPARLDLMIRPQHGGTEFLCLEPATATGWLAEMESHVVHAFEPFRAPLTEADRARRRPDRLTARQRVLLDRFGYPFVLDAFHPHFSLTGAVKSANLLRQAFSNLVDQQAITAELLNPHLALLVQETPSHRFRSIAHIPITWQVDKASN
jgi:hypothetical protein